MPELQQKHNYKTTNWNHVAYFNASIKHICRVVHLNRTDVKNIQSEFHVSNYNNKRISLNAYSNSNTIHSQRLRNRKFSLVCLSVIYRITELSQWHLCRKEANSADASTLCIFSEIKALATHPAKMNEPSLSIALPHIARGHYRWCVKCSYL